MDSNLLPDLDPPFEPMQRARSNTWPLPRPDNFDESASPTDIQVKCEPIEQIDLDIKCSPSNLINDGSIPILHGSNIHCNQIKKNSSRRNAWGNLSYADLITQAISSAPDNRLTLSQIYEWMVHNVPYFKDKGDNNSSAGWKNSIRHNLSLHNRFIRVQNEGTGKSSWWMLNPDAKPGKSARRRATSMETSKFEKRRGRVKKKVDALRNGLQTTLSPSSSISETLDHFPESPLHGFQLSPDFRTRASSNASSCSRLSPIPAVEQEWANYIPPEQLAENLEQNMRINQTNSLLYNTPPPSYQQHSTPLIQQSPPPPPAYRIPFSHVTTQSQNQCGSTHDLQSCNSTFITDINMSPCTRSANSSPIMSLLGNTSQSLLDDLNINIESLQGDFECNVDEVIRHELSIGGSLDFNFSTPTPIQPSPTSQPSSNAQDQSPFSGPSWVQ